MDKVTVTAPGHLHAGNFDLSGDLGRLYGTVGFALEQPTLEIEAKRSGEILTKDKDAHLYAERFIEKYDLPGAEIEVNRALPKYVGIGHHTTLALSIGKGLSRLHNLSLSMEEIAQTMKRGLITALGTYACKSGGFIVEGGFRIEEMEKMVPPLIFRRKIPENWYFVVGIPNASRDEIAEMRKDEEDEILKNLRSMSEELSAELSRIVLVKMIPAIMERDIEVFGDSLSDFNSKLGTVWSDYQEGIYCNDVVKRGVEILKDRAYCACQSSWGPTFYGIVDDESDAARLTEDLKDLLEDNGGGDIFYTKGRNEGLELS
ncbi:GHMP kinase [candidate division MSBL1 archaeon SCGC-AAA382A03]|uniref:Beta-ribofuranosylaminobenzene 5'-phosphate synthase n=1 Tax=candidate division MSBL1 archaeon SCGC-AAA382A03 TaxID=1698278 RepID=A0A133VDG7_9EURY|nr:GHMP kinase [candidate division MSBL1 archaeon SCGC-AAA382A03]